MINCITENWRQLALGSRFVGTHILNLLYQVIQSKYHSRSRHLMISISLTKVNNTADCFDGSRPKVENSLCFIAKNTFAFHV